MRWLTKIFHALVTDLSKGQISLHAASLVYTTLLSIVPLLALSFSVLKGFGVHNQLEPVLLTVLAPLGDKAAQITDQLIAFVSNMKVGVLGAAGLGFLLYTVFSIMHKVVTAINFTWNLDGKRSSAQRFFDYFAVLLVTPLLIFSLAGAASGILHSEVAKSLLEYEVISLVYRNLLLWLPMALNVVALSFIYWFFPGVKVRWYAAFTGGLLAALLWKLIGYGFTVFVAHSVNYTAIYSAFATVLLFMIWLYLSWLILLLGSRMAYYTQFPGARVAAGSSMPPVQMEQAGLETIRLIHQNFAQDKGAISLPELVASSGYPESVLQTALLRFTDAGIIAAIDEQASRFILAKRPQGVRMDQVVKLLRHGETHADAPSEATAGISSTIDQVIDDALGQLTLHEWGDNGIVTHTTDAKLLS